MDYHPIQGEVEILPVASCYRNRDKLRPDGPLDPNADFTFFFYQIRIKHYFAGTEQRSGLKLVGISKVRHSMVSLQHVQL